VCIFCVQPKKHVSNQPVHGGKGTILL
jgi:hypothetical protein